MASKPTRIRLTIRDMTCTNCQNKIEKTLQGTAGIYQAIVSFEDGTADVVYNADSISIDEILQIIERLGYSALSEETREKTDLTRTISLLVIILCLYLLLQQFGILNLLVPSQLADTTMGFGMLFVVGLLTSVHCIAMCGGINLSQSIPREAARPAHHLAAFLPTALYNLGRVISYTVIGFFLGLIGFILGGGAGAGAPVLLHGILKLIAGVFMIITGINMLNLIPGLRKIHLPSIQFQIGRTGRGGPLIVGLLNGLMPCGPLQSMQIVALASGSPIRGGLSMFLFSLGTVPLMLGLGAIVTALGQRFTRTVMNIGAILVVVLGLAMLSQGGTLSGLIQPTQLLGLILFLCALAVVISLPFPHNAYRIAVTVLLAVVIFSWFGRTPLSDEANTPSQSQAQIMDGTQVVTSTLASGSYPHITILPGIPVKWIINASDDSINGCNYRMLLQDFDIEYTFQPGENIIELPAMEEGVYSYSCWMGMIYGSITVTADGAVSGDTSSESISPYDSFSGCCG